MRFAAISSVALLGLMAAGSVRYGQRLIRTVNHTAERPNSVAVQPGLHDNPGSADPAVSDSGAVLAVKRGKPKADQDKTESKAESVRRLESFTWAPNSSVLTWDISTGSMVDDSYKPKATDHYQIDLDKATMTFNGETRRFSDDEAATVQSLMRLLSQYAVESTVWFETGQGDPVDGNGTGSRPGTNQGNPGKQKKPQVDVETVSLRGPSQELAEVAGLLRNRE